MKSPAFSDPHIAELAEVLGFSSDDLAANRKGYLSAAQIRRVTRVGRFWIVLVALIVGLPLISAAVSGSYWDEPSFYAAAAGLILVAGLAVWGLRWYAKKLSGAVVDSATIHPPDAETGLYTHFPLQNGQKLYMSALVYKRLDPAQDYLVYFTPYLKGTERHGPRLLSMERVQEPPR